MPFREPHEILEDEVVIPAILRRQRLAYANALQDVQEIVAEIAAMPADAPHGDPHGVHGHRTELYRLLSELKGDVALLIRRFEELED